MFPYPSVVEAIRLWASERGDVHALAIVGSHARGTATGHSDIDVVILATNPAVFRTQGTWLRQIPWPLGMTPCSEGRDREYGALWSRHLFLRDGTPLELSFGSAEWARTDPVDPGTRNVVQGGCQVVWDPAGLLAALQAAVA